MKKFWLIGGIICGVIGGIYLFGTDPLKNTTCTARTDTVYVPVVHREVAVETLYLKPKPLSKPSDHRRIDSVLAACTQKDSLIAYLLEPKEAGDTVTLATPNGIYVHGYLSKYSVPIDTFLEAAVRLDSLNAVPERVIENTKMVTVPTMAPEGILIGGVLGAVLTIALVLLL